jgi:hypothetical protein
MPYIDLFHTHAGTGVNQAIMQAGPSFAGNLSVGSQTSGSSTTNITINPGSANTAFPIVPPAMALPYILRII